MEKILGQGGEAQRSLFIVLELVEGMSFAYFIARQAKDIPLSDKLAIAIQLARAIEAVNLAGVIHRDIKPENIIIEQEKNGKETGE